MDEIIDRIDYSIGPEPKTICMTSSSSAPSSYQTLSLYISANLTLIMLSLPLSLGSVDKSPCSSLAKKNIVSLTLQAARTHLCMVCCTLSALWHTEANSDSHQPLSAYGMLNASRKRLVHHRGPEMKNAFQNRCYDVRNFSRLIGVPYDIHSSSMLAEPILILSPNTADSENHHGRQ